MYLTNENLKKKKKYLKYLEERLSFLDLDIDHLKEIVKNLKVH